MIGKDIKLITLLAVHAHIFRLPGVGQQQFHRSKVSTAGFMRNGAPGVYIVNSQRQVGSIINDGFRCRRFGGSIQYIQSSHHRVSLQPPYCRLSLDILGPYEVQVVQSTRSFVKV